MNATAIVSAAGLLGATLPAHDALKIVSQFLRGMFEIDRVSFAVYDRSRDDFSISFVEVDGPSRYGPGIRLPRQGTRTGDAFSSKHPRVSNDLERDHFLEDKYLAAEGMRTGISLPLINDAGALGTLNVDWRRPAAADATTIDIIQAAGNAFTNGASKYALSRLFAPCADDMSASKIAAPTQTLAEIEAAHIISVLKSRGWRVSGNAGAAEALAVHPNTLRSRMQKLGIKRPSILNTVTDLPTRSA